MKQCERFYYWFNAVITTNVSSNNNNKKGEKVKLKLTRAIEKRVS